RMGTWSNWSGRRNDEKRNGHKADRKRNGHKETQRATKKIRINQDQNNRDQKNGSSGDSLSSHQLFLFSLCLFVFLCGHSSSAFAVGETCMRAFAACFIVALFAPVACAEFRAGAVAVDVTPEKFPVIVNGMFTARVANSATDRLHARCL